MEQEQKKKDELKRQQELAELFKPIVQQKVPFGNNVIACVKLELLKWFLQGVDPKTILCAHFKAGQCNKGAKCKFSHDLDISRRAVKADLYTDHREKDGNF
jgi:Zinc finger C-x8-C-x5-C-x3-H type (and similar)